MTDEKTESASVDSSAELSGHVRRAMRGDLESFQRVIQRFTPLLLAQAELRLGRTLRIRSGYAPEDLVGDVWCIALRRPPGLSGEAGSATRLFAKFLATTLLHRVRDLVRKYVSGKPSRVEPEDVLSELGAEQSGIVTKAVRGEHIRVLHEALSNLAEEDRRLVVLRGIEGHPVREIAVLFGLEPNTVSVRYRRALERLRSKVPPKFVADLEEA